MSTILERNIKLLSNQFIVNSILFVKAQFSAFIGVNQSVTKPYKQQLYICGLIGVFLYFYRQINILK